MSDRLDEEVARILGKKPAKDFDLSEVDSLARAEIIYALEEIHGLTLTNQQILGFKTYADIKALVPKK